MRERILLICDGQGGGNIGATITGGIGKHNNKKLLSYFINTCDLDLNSLIDINDDFKYHIPNSTGCHKDRKKAKILLANYHEHISNIIDKKFATQDIIYFVFSMAGGTGGGISPLLLDHLSRKNPNKHYGAIVILPSSYEPIRALSNAVECYNELIKIQNIKNIFMLDNNYGNKFTINGKFAEMFNQLLDMATPDKRGNIDEAELETLLTTKGYVLMSYIDKLSLQNGNYNECLMESKIFAPMLKGCDYIGLYMNDEVNPQILESIVGIPKDTYIGYNSEVNFMVATGMRIDECRVESMAELSREKELIRREEKECSLGNAIEVPKFADEEAVKQKPKENVMDFDSLFSKYM